jgi:hypothetical protein
VPVLLQRVWPVRPNELRIFDLSRFSRRFISVRKVLRILAFKSSVRCKPLVATRANRSPLSVMNRMISRCRSCGAFPSAVSRRISAQLPSIDSVKCKTQTCCCSASAGGESFLHTVTLHGIAMEHANWGSTRKVTIPGLENPVSFRRRLRILHSLFPHPVSLPPIPSLCPPRRNRLHPFKNNCIKMQELVYLYKS